MLKFRREQGFSLILMLIFLQIFAVLSISALQSNIMAARMVRNEWLKNNLVNTATRQLALLIKQPMIACLLPPLPPQKLIQWPVSTWQQSSCTGNLSAFTYYYVIETLGNDSCAHIIDAAINTTASYYRITLLVVDNLHPAIKTILQATTVTPGTGSDVCQAEMRQIRHGQQTWHKLI